MISVRRQSCAAPISKVERHITDTVGYIWTWTWDRKGARHDVFCRQTFEVWQPWKQTVAPKLSCLYVFSLRGRRLKGSFRKGVLGARETRGAREEGGRETPARKPLFSPSRLLIMYAKITQLWMTNCQISMAAMRLFTSYFACCFSFVFLKQEIWSKGTIKKSTNAVVRWRKKVATMRGLLYKIQHKSVTFLLKVSCWTSQLACNVCRWN